MLLFTIVSIFTILTANSDGTGFILSPHNSQQISKINFNEVDLSNLIKVNSIVTEASIEQNGFRFETYNFKSESYSTVFAPYSFKNIYDILVEPTGKVFCISGDPQFYFNLPLNVGQACGVTLTPLNGVFAIACRMKGGAGDFIQGYDLSTKKLAWQINMGSDLFGENLNLTWFGNKYIIAGRRSHTGCAYAVFDITNQKELFSQEFKEGDEHFQLMADRIFIHSLSGIQTVRL